MAEDPTPIPEREPLLTPEQVADYLQISAKQVGKYLRAGTLRGFRIAGHRWRISRSDLETFLEHPALTHYRRGHSSPDSPPRK
jgi:excisionase family DNA binding protein